MSSGNGKLFLTGIELYKLEEVKSKLEIRCNNVSTDYNPSSVELAALYRKHSITAFNRQIINNKTSKRVNLEIENETSFYELLCRSLWVNKNGTGSVCAPNWINVKFCLNCLEYGHYESRCTSNTTAGCAICNGTHSIHNCHDKSKHECRACAISGINSNHTSFDPNCPTYQKQFADVNERYVRIITEHNNMQKYKELNVTYQIIIPRFNLDKALRLKKDYQNVNAPNKIPDSVIDKITEEVTKNITTKFESLAGELRTNIQSEFQKYEKAAGVACEFLNNHGEALDYILLEKRRVMTQNQQNQQQQNQNQQSQSSVQNNNTKSTLPILNVNVIKN